MIAHLSTKCPGTGQTGPGNLAGPAGAEVEVEAEEGNLRVRLFMAHPHDTGPWGKRRE